MPKPPPSNPIVLYWHRTDLRLHDSPALKAALSLNPQIFIPLWTWDPHYVYRSRVGPNRWRFLLESQEELSKSYKNLNPNQQLWVVREAPITILPKLFQAWGITHLVFEKDTDSYARLRDEEVLRLAEKAGVDVIVRMGRNLFDPDELVSKNGGKATMSMAQVEKASGKIGNGCPEKVVDTPGKGEIPDALEVEKMKLDFKFKEGGVDAEPDLNKGFRTGKDKQYVSVMGPKHDFGVPTLEEIGINIEDATTPHRGGEKEALRILESCIKDEEYIGRFEKPNTSPADFEPQSTTILSPHLHFGTLSVRKFWWDVQDILEKRRKEKKSVSTIPTNLPGQLLFRDMYFGAQAAVGDTFATTYRNPVVRLVDWHLQSKNLENGSEAEDDTRGYTVDSEEAEEWFIRWREGRTGFPWIDALMRQLRREGWIHHLGRHSVACFLTRGGCYVSWERGAEVFEELLIDHETACNIGNWMWLSCTAFFAQYYRCYSPIAFGRKWDPEGTFIRRYVPELADFDKKYIYEPWKAPIADQKKWGCRVTGDGSGSSEEGKTYPKPMFDFDKRRQICLDSMKNAYDVGLHGADKEVMDGSWVEKFHGDEKPKKRQKTEK
ncbi:DNA photolyase [Penicillium angulare]|uniref:DNA photolyase n=1 Tax=Penicillium angulare TaxID=116970 RepID=UPI0025420E24|nr:DNA photolyase [Penicillium angulare]KAJ5267192.1 DNA photolyase [Penicillium angulare]